jgi:PPOX class probable F420-dependent enzyme
MDDGERAAFVAGARSLILVTVRPDGLPHPVPMWFVVVGGEVRMRTYAASRKVANLRRDPRAVCLVEDGADYGQLRAVQLTGTIELVAEPRWIADVVVRLRAKHEQARPDDHEAAVDAALYGVAKQVGLRLHVRQTVSWDHRKLAG